ncbi:MAG: TonB C-terminal domain-containing protein, partial [Betaproteobacteria bacterium]
MNDHAAPPRREPPGKKASAALTVAVHVGLALFLFFGIRWQSQPPASLEVELASAPPRAAAPVAAPAPEPKPEPKPEPRPEPKSEPKPIVQPKPQPKPEPPPEPKAQPKPEIA